MLMISWCVCRGVKASTTSRRSFRCSNTRRQTEKAKRKAPPPPPLFPKHPPKDPHSLENCDRAATPACIRALYNIDAPNSDKPVSPNNSLGIFEEWDLCKSFISRINFDLEQLCRASAKLVRFSTFGNAIVQATAFKAITRGLGQSYRHPSPT